MSDPSNHPADGEAPTVGVPAPEAPAAPVAPQTPPAPGPVPPPAPPPPTAPPPGGGWGYPPPPGGWTRRGGWRGRGPALTIAVGLVGLLLGCLLGGAVTLVATHWNHGYQRGPARPAPFYQQRRGPGFAPNNRPGFGQNPKVRPASPAPSPTG